MNEQLAGVQGGIQENLTAAEEQLEAFRSGTSKLEKRNGELRDTVGTLGDSIHYFEGQISHLILSQQESLRERGMLTEELRLIREEREKLEHEVKAMHLICESYRTTNDSFAEKIASLAGTEEELQRTREELSAVRENFEMTKRELEGTAEKMIRLAEYIRKHKEQQKLRRAIEDLTRRIDGIRSTSPRADMRNPLEDFSQRLTLYLAKQELTVF